MSEMRIRCYAGSANEFFFSYNCTACFLQLFTSTHTVYVHWINACHLVYFVTVSSLFLQKFFLQGRFIFGPDVRSLALTIFLIVAPVAVFCVFVARKLMDDFADDWGISIMVIAIVFTFYVCFFSHTPLWKSLCRMLCCSIFTSFSQKS